MPASIRRTIYVPTISAGESPTALEEAANALSVGQWADYTAATNLTTSNIVTTGASTTIYAYGSKGVYDATRKQIVYIGKCAGSGRPVRIIRYDEASDAWATVYTGEPPNYDEFGHNYDAVAVHPTTGDVYWRNYTQDSSTQVDVWTGSAWGTSINGPSGSHAVLGALEWQSNIGGGRLLWLDSTRGIHGLQIGGSWTEYASAGSLSGVTIHMMMRYSPAAGVTLFGGGGDPDIPLANNLNCWTLDSSGTVTAATDLPFALQHRDGGAITYAANGDFIVLFGNGEIYRYVASTDTWSDYGSNHDLLAYPAIPLPYNGVTMFLDTQSDLVTPRVRLFRP